MKKLAYYVINMTGADKVMDTRKSIHYYPNRSVRPSVGNTCFLEGYMEESHNENIKTSNYILKDGKVKTSFSFKELLKNDDLEKLKKLYEGGLDG